MRAHPTILVTLLSLAASTVAEEAIDAGRAANTIILDATGVKNLRIETVAVEPRMFESTVFAIGRLEEIPSSRSVLSSRISGRAVKVNAFEGDRVEAGEILVEVESRQPGDPPPTIPLKAIQSGIVVESHIQVGQPVEPDSELLDIADQSEMWAVAKIPENQAAKIVVGTKARIRIPALSDVPLEASLTRFGVAADRETGTVEGIFLVENPRGDFKPGMRAEFSIITDRRENVMAVPRKAIQGDPSKRVVFVKDFELKNAFVRSPVHVGEQNDGYIEILSGLFPGDEVVTRGSYSLGFAGGGSISLKEALDAAHGHEHNEDGSEMTAEQKAAREPKAGGSGNGDGRINSVLKIYSIVVTLLLLVVASMLWKNRQATA